MAGKTLTRPYDEKNAGAVSVAEARIDFAAADARVYLASLPAGAIILRAWFDIETSFDSGTSDELNMGWGDVGAATSDDIIDAVDGTGSGIQGEVGPLPVGTLAAAQDIYLYHLTGGTAPTAGSAKGYILFARAADNGESNGFYGA